MNPRILKTGIVNVEFGNDFVTTLDGRLLDPLTHFAVTDDCNVHKKQGAKKLNCPNTFALERNPDLNS